MSDVPSPNPEIQTPVERPGERFVINVLWSWFGVAVQLLPGLIVSPYLIFKLGSERYGIWSLAFSLVGYYALVDLGFRSAAVRYAAHFRALGETENINELVNTLFLYFSTVAIALIGVTILMWQRADQFFHVPSQHHDEFAWLVLLAGINLSAGIVGGVFSGCVEGFHRFDVSNRILIVAFGARSGGWFALLATGYGLIALGAWALVTNCALILMYGWAFYRMFPTLASHHAHVPPDCEVRNPHVLRRARHASDGADDALANRALPLGRRRGLLLVFASPATVRHRRRIADRRCRDSAICGHGGSPRVGPSRQVGHLCQPLLPNSIHADHDITRDVRV